jgi:acyl-CoA thioesterase-1
VLGVSSPASSASSVDLPEPDAPTMASASPEVTSSPMSRRMTRSLVPLNTLLPMPLAIRTLLFLFMLCPLMGSAAGKTILVFGDSLSAGYGLAMSRGWVSLLEEKLKQERIDYSVANASVSGDTSAGGRARIDAALERHRPSVVVVELGANDALRGLPLAQMKANLAAIIERSKKAGARALLLGMKMPPNFGPDYTVAFERVFSDLAREKRVTLVPFMLEGFADNLDYFQPDRIHPNERAQPLILDTIWPKLAPLLK